MINLTRLLFCTSLVWTLAPSAFAQGTAFTYQGRLNDTATPATGSFDLTFSLFSVASGAGQVATTITNTATPVSNGLFSATVDFGNQFPGAARWLELGVRTNCGGAFATLSPRQALTSSPYAIRADAVTGSVATNIFANAITSTMLAANSVTSSKIADGAIVNADLSATAGITDGRLATITTAGKVADTALSANVALLAANQLFSGSNRFAGILVATNGNNRFSGDGSGLTNLNASQFSTGTISDARLSANVALLDAVQTFAAAKSFGAGAQLLGDPGTAAGPGLSFQGNTNTGVFRPAANSVAIATSGSERLRIDSTGKVGIGTNAPANLLAVAGAGTGSGGSGGVSEVVGHFINTNASNHSAVSVDATAGQDSILYFAEAGQAWWDLRHDSSDAHKLNFRYQGGANVNSTLMVIASNGNVGIGLTAPTNKLHVAGGVSATAFVTTSDRNAKENFAPVSPADVLARVTALPINTWNFKELKDGRHLGPTAQDFYSAFKLGGSETGITTVDADGVALAAIQGLNEKLEQSVQEKEARIAALEASLEELRAMVRNLAKDRLASAAAD